MKFKIITNAIPDSQKVVSGIQKGFLLFEAAFTVFLVSLMVFFLFRGYGIFLKSGKMILEYHKLMMLSEEKMWDLQILETDESGQDIETAGVDEFFSKPFNWSFDIQASDYTGLSKGILKVSFPEGRNTALDMVLFTALERSS